MIDRSYYRIELLNNMEDSTDLSSNHDKLKSDLAESDNIIIAGIERIQDQ